mmetsp:Transcript_8145/g.12515  ORF Transcript_8145/g.12515 Transcript_8145/m.12515 type:complete len:113 (+) Transcript_8145:142-480(+)
MKPYVAPHAHYSFLKANITGRVSKQESSVDMYREVESSLLISEHSPEEDSQLLRVEKGVSPLLPSQVSTLGTSQATPRGKSLTVGQLKDSRLAVIGEKKPSTNLDLRHLAAL